MCVLVCVCVRERERDRLVVLYTGLESGLKSIFAGLGLGKVCNQVQFSLCTFAVFC